MATKRKPIDVVIVLDGGMIQDILSAQPIRATIIDYDVEGAEESDLTAIPQLGGGVEYAYARQEKATRIVKRTRELVKAVEVGS